MARFFKIQETNIKRNYGPEILSINKKTTKKTMLKKTPQIHQYFDMIKQD